MSFLALLIALAIVQLWGSGGRVQRDQWFFDWRRRVGQVLRSRGLQLAAVVLIPSLAVAWFMTEISSLLFGLIWLLFAVLLLLYAFGRGAFLADLQRYRGQCARGDFEAAFLTTSASPGWVQLSEDPVSPQEVHGVVQREFVYEGYQRWFAVIFYYVLLGPAGALAYRLLQLSREDPRGGPVREWLRLLDWLPSRLLAATFAVTGNFAHSSAILIDTAWDFKLDTRDLLYATAEAALEADPALIVEDEEIFARAAADNNESLAGLLSRSAACWVLLLALFEILL